MKAFLVVEKFVSPKDQPYKTLVISQDGKASFGDVEKAVDSNDTVPSSRQTHIVDIQALEMDRVVILPEKKS
jgi:hypothetical protein